jgi:hypothetical protein
MSTHPGLRGAGFMPAGLIGLSKNNSFPFKSTAFAFLHPNTQIILIPVQQSFTFGAFLLRMSFERQRAGLRFGSKGIGEVGGEVPQTIMGDGASRSDVALAAVTMMTTTLSTVVLANRRAPDDHLPRTDPQ